MSKTTIKTTCPRDCYDGCGISVVMRDGAISRVAGNPDHPANRGPLCGKCAIAYNGVWIDENARLTQPLRRSGPKGSGAFEAISWDEALEEVAKKLSAISQDHGANSIYHTHYTGTCSVIANSFPERFFNHIGAIEIDPDTVCNKAGHVAWGYVFGDSCNGFDPRTVKDSKCVMVWGANPSASAPHVHKLWLKEADATTIVIDPVRHETAAEADIHLHLHPGSDAALAFSLLHVMQRDGLLDEDFIANHVVGYDEVAAQIKSCTPQWGEDQTGVAADLIERVAKIYAEGPSLLWMGQGVQRQRSGGNIFRACAMLPALTGNIGKPGAGAYYLNSTFSIAARGGASPEFSISEEGPTVSQMDIPALLNSPDTIRSYFVWNCNPIASNPNQSAMRSGLARDDLFTVVADCFMTDTAKYADIVLPAASFLEFDDLNASYFHLMIGPQVKCADPIGESLPNQEIFRRLAAKMGLDAPELFETDQDIIHETLAACQISQTWDELKEIGWAYISEDTLVLWGDKNFATPSGKIEIASAQAEEDGLPLVPHSNADTHSANGTMRLLSPADKMLMNSSYGNDPKVREQMGAATVTIHPDDAGRLELSNGDTVALENAGGRATFTARVSDIVNPGSLLAPKSRWPGFEPESANVNLLHLPQKTDMGESTSVHSTEVRLEKV